MNRRQHEIKTVQFVPAIDENRLQARDQAMKFLAGFKNVRVWCGLLLSLCVSGTVDDDGDDQS